jgi:Ca-activated chloride channel family protein
VEFLKDEKGQPVKSRLDDSTLREIATLTGGAYQPLGQQGQGLDAIYKNGLAELPKQEIASRMNKIYIERFQWPLALAILLLIIEMMLGERKFKGFGLSGKKAQTFKFQRKQQVAAALLLTMLATTAWASPQSAEKAYKQGKYPEAVAQYKEAA